MKRMIALIALALEMSTGVSAAGEHEMVQSAGPLRQSIAREAVRLAGQNPVSSTPRASQHNWAGRHPVALGMMIGLAAGVAVGASQEYEGKRPFGPLVALQGGIGLGIGAGLGAIVSIANR
jgi:hypothetical protein